MPAEGDAAGAAAEGQVACVATSKGGDAAHSVSHGGTNSRAARRNIWSEDISSTSYATFRFVRSVDKSE